MKYANQEDIQPISHQKELSVPSNKLPNLKHLSKDPLPSILFLDTNFLFSALIKYRQEPKRRFASAKFLERIRQEKKIIAFSSLVFPEFWCGVIINEVIMRYNLKSGRAEEKARKMIKDDSTLIGEYFARVKKEKEILKELLSKFQEYVQVIETDIEINKKAFEAMEKYCLESYDAIHIGTMLRGNFRDFVTFDRTIQKNCYDINIWCLFD